MAFVLYTNMNNFVSVSSKPLVIRISSSANPGYISKAVTTVKRFLDNVGAWYKYHRSNKSNSEYFLVERPNDRMSPEVDVRVSDHNLPHVYDQPDLDIDPSSPGRIGSYSVPEALDLLEGFFDGEYVNIVEGEPIVSSKTYTPLYYGNRKGIIKSSRREATLERFNKIEQTQPDVWRILHTKASDPSMQGYNTLLGVGSWDYHQDSTLAGLIRDSWKKGYTTFFLEDNEVVHGFLAFMVSGDTIYNVKTFSVVRDVKNGEDLKRFVRDYVPNYNLVWEAREDNKACKRYEDITRLYGGTVTPSTENPNHLIFKIRKGSVPNSTRVSLHSHSRLEQSYKNRFSSSSPTVCSEFGASFKQFSLENSSSAIKNRRFTRNIKILSTFNEQAYSDWFLEESSRFLGKSEDEVLSLPNYKDKLDTFLDEAREWHSMSQEERERWYLSGAGRTICTSSVVRFLWADKSYPSLYSKLSQGNINKSMGRKFIFNSKEMLSGGVWISPSGDMFGVPLTHIKAVIEDPAKFGLSVEQLKAIYNKHNEGIGSEGDARDEVISLLIFNGWVRIRFYPGEYFHVELNKLSQKYKNVLFSWASKVISKSPEKKALSVIICERLGNFEYSFKLEDLQVSFVSSGKTGDLAYWISPSGELISTHGSHTSTVVETPEVFGFTEEEVNTLFSVGEEEAVLKCLIGNGWIRLRYQAGCYFVSVLSLSPETQQRLQNWALHEGNEDKDTTVIIEMLVSFNVIKVTLRDVSRGVFSHDASLPIHSSVDYDEWSLIPSSLRTIGNAQLIESATIQDLLDENDKNPEFTHRAEHLDATKAQGDSEITRCYASTVELRTKSEHFKENNTYYRQWVLFKDFVSIARDKKIKLEDAVDYAINFCDITIRCSCPDFLYRGYSYMGDQLGYLYGLPREKRFPKRNNPNLKLAVCKHSDIALEHLLKNKEKLIKMFGVYYKRIKETPPDTMIAVPAKAAEEKKEESIEDFLAGFDEDGNKISEEKADLKEDDGVETISEQDPDSGVIKIDTKLAEGNLPPDQQVKYAGDEDKPVDENTLENVADSISDEEEEELATQIDEASLSGSPRNDNEKFMHEWSFQRFKPNTYTDLYPNNYHASLITSSPDKDYEPAKSYVRNWLDSICKSVQANLKKKGVVSTISPVTGLTWKVAVGQKDVLKIDLSFPSGNYCFSYTYLDRTSKSFSGKTMKMDALIQLVPKVGV